MGLYGNDPLIRACSVQTDLDKCFPGNLIKFIDHRHRWVTATVLSHRYDLNGALVIRFITSDGRIVNEFWDHILGNVLLIATCK